MVLNVVLIPRYSYTGAAITSVITFGVCAVALWVVVARTLPVTEPLPVGSLITLAILTAAVCAGGVWAADHVPWPVVSVLAALIVAAPGVALLKRVGSPPGRHAKVVR